ncbi:unnamed protein product [Didymodactylos carnosus]|uniref:Uncharacterized protein n=1 Tax=Didymodactylos carnosus TaxID=1234261 RepID=A0A815YM79_9BILA|nr:unnamed protein product [Didymodactylos carnosus]CAF4435339.1 unnamed protein product [Didymodactylos carnosus]
MIYKVEWLENIDNTKRNTLPYLLDNTKPPAYEILNIPTHSSIYSHYENKRLIEKVTTSGHWFYSIRVSNAPPGFVMTQLNETYSMLPIHQYCDKDRYIDITRVNKQFNKILYQVIRSHKLNRNGLRGLLGRIHYVAIECCYT